MKMCAQLLSTQPYKGTRDFYPNDMRLRNWFFGVIRNVLETSAFEEYNGPMLESLALYAAKSGEELAGEQTYNFFDKGNRHMAIRPEMTPTVARMVAAKMGELNFPLRWFSFPNMYRCENPQRGRLREFWQVNVDVFGCDTYEADLECIVSAIRLLRAFGADSSMFTVHISNRRFFNDVVSTIANTDMEGCRKISKVIDKRKKIPREVYEQELLKLGMDASQIEKLDSLYSATVQEATALCPDSVGSQELLHLFDMLSRIGLSDFCAFDFGIIRGLDYYTGTVFEVFDNAPENNRAMFGGGRYDNLVGLFVNNAKISGVGYGMGDVTLENFLNTHGLIPETLSKRKVLITRFSDVSYEHYMALSDKLYNAGITSSIYLATKKFGKQIDYAVKENYSHVIIMGASELEAGTVKIKDLATREESTVALDSIEDYFKA
ncbi:MAG: histidine--tRNA ligase [Ruminococcaceae bacterium]|nr:histidine--tRNA ligase [Oscillospiraceae bacterium]